ncbi:DNA ligase [Helicobacter turcicus]|uniref:DNA ligase n=1 Tax=Helicobacter turcicus TaxID=2867412 RepID=A0ABS7JN79_9HELI|nr:DNA ligase [Helicobacter turcicus]MBX7490856.1 DNA ligase [Helicobacter turcicus]MBX7545710.1 DNA ligase [Helicobacter turcicus]
MNKAYKLKILILFFFIWNLAFAGIPRFQFYKTPLDDTELKAFVMSEKLDGVRGIWDGKSLKTRNGNPIKAPKFWLDNFPPFILDGELWLRRDAFAQTLSVIKNTIPKQWEQITLQVFDVRGVCKDCTLQTRLNILQEYLENNPSKFIKIIPQIPIENQMHLEKFYQSVLEKGGEGVIIRNNTISNIGYKLKPFMDAECIVQGYTQGRGRNARKLGAVICEATINGIQKRFKIGSGFSDRERENPPKIGTKITYKYQGYTKNGIPRFPIFLRVREGD